METNIDNKNQNIKELTDEQLKQVAGGGEPCPPLFRLQDYVPYNLRMSGMQ